MLRRGRSGRTRHLAWIEPRQDAEAMAEIQVEDREEVDDHMTMQVIIIHLIRKQCPNEMAFNCLDEG